MLYRFRRWLRNWINHLETDQIKKSSSDIIEGNEPNGEKSLHFRVWFANGGKVIQTSRYDRLKDRTQTSMYVITEEHDFGEEINKIITIEGLRG